MLPILPQSPRRRPASGLDEVEHNYSSSQLMPMAADLSEDILVQLAAAGLLTSDRAFAQPLTGGISSDIWLITAGDKRFVVKRALAKLRVSSDWFADTCRNQTEREWLAYAARVVPRNVPRIIYASAENDWFAMEFIGDQHVTWKSELLEGVARIETARMIGKVLGQLHASSWGNTELAKQFDTSANFRELRLAPYFITAAERVPELAPMVLSSTEQLERTQLALVHGDFSPKNLLVTRDRVIVLDAEVAWFGDPAFDAAFLINHLLLKGLLHSSSRAKEDIVGLVVDFWNAYAAALGKNAGAGLEARVVRLTLCLLLARVHGKSPVEYLSLGHGAHLTNFVRQELPRPPLELTELSTRWLKHIRGYAKQ